MVIDYCLEFAAIRPAKVTLTSVDEPHQENHHELPANLKNVVDHPAQVWRELQSVSGYKTSELESDEARGQLRTSRSVPQKFTLYVMAAEWHFLAPSREDVNPDFPVPI